MAVLEDVTNVTCGTSVRLYTKYDFLSNKQQIKGAMYDAASSGRKVEKQKPTHNEQERN